MARELLAEKKRAWMEATRHDRRISSIRDPATGLASLAPSASPSRTIGVLHRKTLRRGNATSFLEGIQCEFPGEIGGEEFASAAAMRDKMIRRTNEWIRLWQQPPGGRASGLRSFTGGRTRADTEEHREDTAGDRFGDTGSGAAASVMRHSLPPTRQLQHDYPSRHPRGVQRPFFLPA